MPKCFVIQPFSNPYQKLYDDVFRDAIEDAGLSPYKVDEDASASILIETIEKEIRSSDFCFADISENNANVWYELGFAIASGKGVCLACAKQSRSNLPFDVQHRKVLFYDKEAPSDFLKLRKEITGVLSALLEKGQYVRSVTSAVSETSPDKQENSLEEHVIMTLALIAAEQLSSQGSASVYSLKSSMNQAGYNDIATTLGIRFLEERESIELFEAYDGNNNYDAVRLTELGWALLQRHKGRLTLKKTRQPSKLFEKVQNFSQDFDDEIPF